MKAGPVRAVMLLLALGLSSAAFAAKPPPPFTGELQFDMDDPVLDVTIGEVPLRLRVALDQKRLIELNPDAVDRLNAQPPDRRFRFEDGFDAQIGRERLQGIQAAVILRLNDRKMQVTLASHGRPCCAGVDGEIGIGLLPYANIRFVRSGRADSTHEEQMMRFTIDDDSIHGPQASVAVGGASLFVQFSLGRRESVATAAAGAILARGHGGTLTERTPVAAPFGIERPASTLRFASPVSLAGFVFDEVAVRTADFGGSIDFPSDPAQPQDIVVSRKLPQQEAWPVVLIGRDRLDRCSEASFDGNSHVLTLRCAGQA